jgi:hypothetical protein
MMTNVAACTTGEETAAIPKSADASQKMHAQFLSKSRTPVVSKRYLLSRVIVAARCYCRRTRADRRDAAFDLAVAIDRDDRALDDPAGRA